MRQARAASRSFVPSARRGGAVRGSAALPAQRSDADLPPFAQEIDKADYLKARAEHISSLMRGVPSFLPYDARARALAEIEDRRAEPWRPDARGLRPGLSSARRRSPTSPPRTAAATGRVSAIAVDPTNPDIVFVGAGAGRRLPLDQRRHELDADLRQPRESLAIGALATPARPTPSILYVGTGESAGSADSFFGVGLYRIDNAATTADLSGPFNPPVATGVAGHAPPSAAARSARSLFIRPIQRRSSFRPTTGTAGNPSNGSIGFTVPPLGMLGIYRSTDATRRRADLHQAHGDVGGLDSAGLHRQPVDHRHGHRSGRRQPPRRLGAGLGRHVRNRRHLLVHQRPGGRPRPSPSGSSRHHGARAASSPGTRVGAAADRFYAAHGRERQRPAAQVDRRRRDLVRAPHRRREFLQSASASTTSRSTSHPTNARHPATSAARRRSSRGRSTDGGTTFTTNAHVGSGRARRHPRRRDRAVDPTVVYIGTDGGIYRSDDGGVTWTSLNNVGLPRHPVPEPRAPSDRPAVPDRRHPGQRDHSCGPDGTWIRADCGDGGYALIDRNAADTTNVTMYHTYFNQQQRQAGFARS